MVSGEIMRYILLDGLPPPELTMGLNGSTEPEVS